MEHQYAEEHQFADRYLMGRLTAEQAAQFEQHYLHCAECVERLEVAEKFGRGLRRAVAQDATRAMVAGQVGLLTRLANTRPRGWLAAAAVAAAVGLPAYLFFARQNQDLQKAQAALAQVEGLDGDRQDASNEREKLLIAERDEIASNLQLRTSERDALASKNAEIRDELNTEKSQRTRTSLALDQALQAFAHLAFVPLSPLRDASAWTRESAPTLVPVSSTPGGIAFQLQLEGPEFETYTATLFDSEADQVFQRTHLVLQPDNILVFSVFSSKLKLGTFEIAVQGQDSSGELTSVGRYAFEAVADD